MCGISGAVGLVDSTILSAVVKINNALTHRGPNAEGLYTDRLNTDQGVALAHRRLSIIDLSSDSNQPFLDKERGLSLVYNGEIYNYLELKKSLESAGHKFITKSDTEVLLKSYIEWGEECVNYFRGMFAFSLYDSKRNIVLVARDRMGIKPLYYSLQQHKGRPVFLFSSEIRALLSSNIIEKKLNPLSLETYLWNGYVSGPDTIVRDIKKLNASSYLIIKLDHFKISEQRYWQIPDAVDKKDSKAKDFSDLKKSFSDAVRLRMISDVPLGVFLSGGVDSSAIVAQASQFTDKLKTFNISFSEEDYDESYYAQKISQIYNTDHTGIRLTENDFSKGLDDALHSLDTPTFDGLNTYYISKAIKDAGITVALSGLGGDELFGGYESFSAIPHLRNFSRILGFTPKSLINPIGKTLSYINYGKPNFIPHQARWAKMGDILSTKGDLLDLYQVTYGLFRQNFIQDLIIGDGRETQTKMGWSPIHRKLMENLVSSKSVLHGISQLEMLNFVGERLIPDTDSTSMASSLEVRVPLIDHDLIETLSLYKGNDRFKPIRRKSLLKDLALNPSDAALFDRPKKGFVFPMDTWCHRNLKGEIDKQFRDKELCESLGLNQEKIFNVWQAYQIGTPGLYWSRIWSLYVLLWWCKTYGISL
jgi:asparagine synthase (glutamine-hydrolysing)